MKAVLIKITLIDAFSSFIEQKDLLDWKGDPRTSLSTDRDLPRDTSPRLGQSNPHDHFSFACRLLESLAPGLTIGTCGLSSSGYQALRLLWAEKWFPPLNPGSLFFLELKRLTMRPTLNGLQKKITSLRILGDAEGRMNHSLLDTGGSAIVVSQFTLHANTKKGNRPSFTRAAPPDQSEPLYQQFCTALSNRLGEEIGKGRFGAMMDVSLVNDGPVTILLDSRKRE